MHCQLGNQLLQKGAWAEAEGEFQRAIQANPDGDQAYNNLGILYMRLQRPAQAEAMLQAAVRLNPKNIAGCVNLGRLYMGQAKYEQAECWLRMALHNQPSPGSPAWFQLQPRLVETSCQLASALQQLERYGEAKAILAEAENSCREIVQSQRDRGASWSILGMVLRAQERFADAEQCYREAGRLDPENLSYLNWVGKSLREQGKLEEAAHELTQILTLNPGMAEAHCDLGLTLAGLGRYPEAVACYDKAIALRPQEVTFRWNRTLALLAAGDYSAGWQDYDLRFQLPGIDAWFPQMDRPLWDGSPLNGRTLLLRAEQGMGDALQYIRYASSIPRGTGGRVLVECRPVLTEILKSCPGVDEVLPQGAPRPPFDLFAPLMSLPRIFGTTLETVPNHVPYLFPPNERIDYWQGELAAGEGVRVGIVWEGSWKGRHRSCPLERFAPLSKVPGVRLVSLQKGPGTTQLNTAGFDVLDLGVRTAPSFADTAALIMNLDLVISIDTSIIHLAGALGVPTWVALANPADWLWMYCREDSPWYPTVRLFRQPRPGDWQGVFARLAEELAGFVRKQHQVQ